jgi:group I intron endonuclease
MASIYKITNTVSGKCYIGETIQKKPENRWRRHINSIKTAKGCPALKDAMKKYGIDQFKFEVILTCAVEDRHKYEKEYIKMYNTQVPNGYNILPGGQIGESRLGTKHTPEAIKKMVENRKKFYEANPNYYETYRERHQESIKHINYSECIKKSEKWKKALEEGRIGGGASEEIAEKIRDGINVYYENGGIEKHRKAMTAKLGKKIKQYSKEGVFIKEFQSIKEASREAGISASNIQHTLSGRNNTSGGYIWKFVDEKDLKT